MIIPEKAEFKCNNSWCGKVFLKKFNLERHVLSSKQKDKTYDCPKCTASFSKPSILKTHQKTHELKMLYLCEYCSNTYQRKDKFQIHIKKCSGLVEEESTEICNQVNSEVDEADGKIVEFEPNFNDQCFTVAESSGTLMELARAYGVGSNDLDDGKLNASNEDKNRLGNTSDSSTNIDDENETMSSSNTLLNESISEVPDVYIIDDNLNRNAETYTGDTCDGEAKVPSVYIIDDIVNLVENHTINTCDDFNTISNEYCNLDYKIDIADSTIHLLKHLRHKARRSRVKLHEFSKYLMLIFASKLDNESCMQHISEDLGFHDRIRNELMDFINTSYDDIIEKRGQPLCDKYDREKMYTHWLENSEISNDR